MINRTQTPEIDFSTIEEIFSKKNLTHEYTLINNIPCYIVDKGGEDLVKIELIFNAGSIYQTKPFVSFSTFRMLTEGTKNMTSSQISERLDFYGAFLEKEIERDFASISLYSLNKHLKNTLPILFDVIVNPIFPDEELSIYKEKQKSVLEINKKQVSYVARTNFTEILYGENHPYGAKIEIDDIEKITSIDLNEFCNKYICPNNCKIIISGKITPETLQLFGENILNSNWRTSEKIIEEKKMELPTNTQCGHYFTEQPNVVQSAIRIGRIMFNIKDPDYNKFQILNTVLGGYFGSRLMKNIREDKGYTYGVGSALLSLKHSGYFFITTEVGKEFTKAAISEIYNEIEKLQNEIIDQDELELVKNYKYGELMRSIDGTFAISEYFKKIIQYDLPIDHIKSVYTDIKVINREEITLLAQKYLRKETLTQLIVGKFE